MWYADSEDLHDELPICCGPKYPEFPKKFRNIFFPKFPGILVIYVGLCIDRNMGKLMTKSKIKYFMDLIFKHK